MQSDQATHGAVPQSTQRWFRVKTTARLCGRVFFFVGFPVLVAVALLVSVSYLEAMSMQATRSEPPHVHGKRLAKVSSVALPVPKPQERVPGIYVQDHDFHNQVAVTFDDGPNQYTGQVLDLLNAHHIKGAFFVVGSKIQNPNGTLNPKTLRFIRRIYDEGHTLGNHTFNHPNLSHSPYLEHPEKIAQEFVRTQKAINKAFRRDYPLQYVRPPYGQRAVGSLTKPAEGVFNAGKVDDWLRQQQKYLVLWSAGACDWDPDLPLWQKEQAVMEQLEARHGGVILLHDIYPQTIVLLKDLLERIESEKTFQFTTLDGLLKQKYAVARPKKP